MSPLRLIVVVVWLMSPPAYAGPQPEVAFKGGAVAATTAADSSANRYGFTGGLAGDLQWSLANKFSLAAQLELLYTPRGPRVVFEGEYQGKFRMRYFDITLAARPGVGGRSNEYLYHAGRWRQLSFER